MTTSNLPKPPVRRHENDSQVPTSPAKPNTKPKPSLPPRLPPRQGSTPIASSPTPPPPYSPVTDAGATQNGQINQGAVSRLGSAGVTVPGFGIGNSSQAAPNAGIATNSPAGAQSSNSANPQLSELQSRFSRFSTSSQNPDTPNQGTSLAEKQAAAKTAQAFHNDPSSVSLSDVKDSAATANNFRERHGEQVSAGWKSANAFNKKHDVGNRLNSYISQEDTSSKAGEQNPTSPANAPSTSLPWHKRAPPPPPQKPSFSGGSTTSPPPVPLSSKPKT